MNIQLISLIIFILAILHTFSVKWILNLSHHFPKNSFGENVLHLLGEVEIVFGFWSFILMFFYMIQNGKMETIHYLEKLNFTEPLFVFAIMIISSTKPVISFVGELIKKLTSFIPFNSGVAFYVITLVFGPLLGSFITEPASMTVTALILFQFYYSKGISTRLKYQTLGLLFVNVSIGGALTNFAAPPILMVAQTWAWDNAFVFTHFGLESIASILISTSLVTFLNYKELKNVKINLNTATENKIPIMVTLSHLFFLFLIVSNSHHPVVFISFFLFFLGLVVATKDFQTELKFKEALLVAFFLGGLVVLGSFQGWWLTIVIKSLSSLTLFLSAIGLTAITDNAALTYLGSQVPDLLDDYKISLVSGAIIGGGLTVIANAPNPVGFGILSSTFGEDGISAGGLFKAAIIPTTIAALIFWFSKALF